MKLAALPRAGIEGGAQCRPQSFVGVGSNTVRDADATRLEAREEPAPVHFGFRECAGNTKDKAFAVIASDADGDEGGAVADVAVDPDLVVGGVGKQVRNLRQRAFAPFFKLRVQFGGQVGDLGGGHLEATEFTHDLGHAAGAHALEIHAGDGGFEGAVAAAALLQKGGAERDVTAPDLRRGQIEAAHGGLEGTGLESIGVAVARFSPFIGSGADMPGPFHEHGGIHEQFGDLGQPFAEAVLKKAVDEIIVGGSGGVVFVHGCCFLFRNSSNQFWADTTTPGVGGAPPGAGAR